MVCFCCSSSELNTIGLRNCEKSYTLEGVCSEEDEKKKTIEYMSKKLKNSEYKADEIAIAQDKATKLDLGTILNISKVVPETNHQLMFTVNRDQCMSMKVKEVLRDHKEGIDKLLGGPTKLIVVERRNANIASLFAKSSFLKVVVTQKQFRNVCYVTS